MEQEKEQEKENLIQICRGNGNLDEVRKILSRHPSLISEALDSDGWALIIYASRYNHISLMEHLLASPEVNVNHQDNDGYTALQWASYRGYAEIVQLLLFHPNIDVNIQNKLGATALHRATYYGRVQIIRLLLSNGNIDVSLKSIKGRTASEVCCEWEKANQSVKPLIVELLQNHATSLPSAPPLPHPATTPPVIPAVPSLEVRWDDGDWEVKIEEVRRCRELKFPSTLQLSFVCLKLLMIRDEVAQARSCKDYKRVSVLGEQKKLWTMWQERLLRMTEKLVPIQLSSEAAFNTAKGFFLEQLEAHFGLCLENCEDEKVLEGIDTFKEQIEVWQEGGDREGSMKKPAIAREPSKFALMREPSKSAAMVREPSRRVSVMDPTPFSALSLVDAFPLPPNKATHVFLTHTWKKDGEGRDNHQRVQKVNDALKTRGLVTWFDSEQMTGQIRQAMTDALYSTCCLLVFITREYENKVNMSEKTDNCYYEFNVAANCHLADARIPVVMEKSMSNPSRWEIGRLKAEIGDELFVDLSSDEEEVFKQRCDELVERVMGLLRARYEGLY